MSVPVGAVVVAGGAARRMGGVDKLGLRVGGSPMLDRVLSAARPLCRRIVVIGPRRPTSVEGVEMVTEEEPGGGPVPAILAGVRMLAGELDIVLVLAGDLPLVTTAALARLLSELAVVVPAIGGTTTASSEGEAAAARDERGGPNPLLAAYRASALETAARRGGGRGDRAARLLPAATNVVDLGDEATLNVNRPDDLRRAQMLLTARAG